MSDRVESPARSKVGPGRSEAQWADEAEPWIDIRLLDVAVDGPVDAALDRTRQRFERR